MGPQTRPTTLVRQASLLEFFRDSVRTAMRESDVRAESGTEHYLADLLARFTRAEQLFERTPDGVGVQCLADCYARAARADSPKHRCHALRQLGDVALFVAGVLPDSLRRKAVDVDYYVAMGGGAYASLSESPHAEQDRKVTRQTYGELARKFVAFSDILAAVSATEPSGDRDLLRAYEIWQKTGSRRAEQRLRRAGITPLTDQLGSQRRH